MVNDSTGAGIGVFTDINGHAQAAVSGSTVMWNPVLSTGYGPAPGSTAQPLDGVHDVSTLLAWREKYIDGTGFYYLGNRYYDPQSGTFLSCDPLGHAASMDLYSYCQGDPLNYYDADGRMATKFGAYLENAADQGLQEYSNQMIAQAEAKVQIDQADYDYYGSWTNVGIVRGDPLFSIEANAVQAYTGMEILREGSGQTLSGSDRFLSGATVTLQSAVVIGTSVVGLRAGVPEASIPGNTGLEFLAPKSAPLAADAPLVQSEFGFVNNLPAKPAVNWPPNNGFLGAPTPATLAPGTMIDRFGYNGGSFVSPQGIPYIQRSLAPGTQYTPYNVFQVMKPIDVNAGPIAPAFGMPGGGMQYKLPSSVQSLIDSGHLAPATGG